MDIQREGEGTQPLTLKSGPLSLPAPRSAASGLYFFELDKNTIKIAVKQYFACRN